MKTDENVPSKSIWHKNFEKKPIFVGLLSATSEKKQDPDP
jgi:hypothetical protein